MSKSIIIQEAGLPQSLTVDALHTSKLGGSLEDWLPADGKNLVELDIGGSGTYRASDYNAYGIAVAQVTPKYGGGATSKTVEHDFTKKHTPSIKEGGKSRNFSAAMLKTNLQGGGTCLWIPRMEVELKNKYISKSGTYTAKADNCFGFDQVTVSGVDVVITQDKAGDDVVRTTNGGEVTETKLPSYIRVTVLPQKLDYIAGETIDYTGLVVHAYTRSGIDMGAVPFGELVFTQEVADPTKRENMAESDLNTSPLEQPIRYANQFKITGNITEYGITYEVSQEYICEDGVCIVYQNSSNRFGYIIGRKDDKGVYIYKRKATHKTAGGSEIIDKNVTFHNDISGWSTSYTHDDKTVYIAYSNNAGLYYGGYVPGPLSYSFRSYDENIPAASMGLAVALIAAWTALYGKQVGGVPIPVSWSRPGDGAILETSFTINVTGGAA